jgi:hypothetical protein
MQADAQFGILLRERNRFVARRLVHHQTGGGQNPFAMRADDGLIDGVGAAEIIRVDDEAS